MTHDAVPSPQTAATVLAAVAVFQAAGQHHRLNILIALRDGPAQTKQLCQQLGLTRSALAHHMRHLRVAELIVQRRQGAYLHYTLTDDNVSAMVSAVLTFASSRPNLSRIGRT
jgi:ArsR family transcriptional regulator